jgi:hypothetical protein
MPPKRNKKSPSKPDPNRISTRPKNAVTHPGQVVRTECSTRRPESIIQAEKAEKAAKLAKKEQQRIKRIETAEAIAEYEQDMAINDTIEDAQFPRHRDKAGMSYCIWLLLLCLKFIFNSQTDRGNGPMKQLNAAHRRTSGTKRKIEDSKQSFEIVDNLKGPEVGSGVEEQPKSKRTRVGIVPANAACHSGKAYDLKSNNH